MAPWPAPFVPLRPLTLKDPRVMVVLRGLRWIAAALSGVWLVGSAAAGI
jgi:hypothetical protein